MVPIVFVKKIEETTNKYPLPFSQSLPNDFYLTMYVRALSLLQGEKCQFNPTRDETPWKSFTNNASKNVHKQNFLELTTFRQV